MFKTTIKALPVLIATAFGGGSAVATAAEPSPLLLSSPVVCNQGIGGNAAQWRVVFSSAKQLTTAAVWDASGKTLLATLPCTTPYPPAGILLQCETTAGGDAIDAVRKVTLSLETWDTYADLEGQFGVLGEVACQKPW